MIARLTTGEAVEVLYSSETSESIHADAVYIGTGYLNDAVKHIWVAKKNYNITDLKMGDKIAYVNNDIITWVIYYKPLNKIHAMCYHEDGNIIGFPLSEFDIIYVEEGNTGIKTSHNLLQQAAQKLGGEHMLEYIRVFGELPLTKGCYIKPLKNYHLENNKLRIRNNHRIINSPDLTFDEWDKKSKFISVKSNNKITQLALNSFAIA